MTLSIRPDYTVHESMDRLPGSPDFVTRFHSRAVRRCRKLNARRIFPSYRYGVVREGRRWAVVAFQNYAVSS
jgi:hypothetical protein